MKQNKIKTKRNQTKRNEKKQNQMKLSADSKMKFITKYC